MNEGEEELNTIKDMIQKCVSLLLLVKPLVLYVIAITTLYLIAITIELFTGVFQSQKRVWIATIVIYLLLYFGGMTVDSVVRKRRLSNTSEPPPQNNSIHTDHQQTAEQLSDDPTSQH